MTSVRKSGTAGTATSGGQRFHPIARRRAARRIFKVAVLRAALDGTLPVPTALALLDKLDGGAR
jgi:hypothetical protein